MKQYPLIVIAKLAEINHLRITVHANGFIICDSPETFDKLQNILKQYEREETVNVPKIFPDLETMGIQ